MSQNKLGDKRIQIELTFDEWEQVYVVLRGNSNPENVWIKPAHVAIEGALREAWENG